MAASPWAGDQSGVQHLHFKYGPIDVKPGQNNIALSDQQVPKPSVDGYILGIAPNPTKEQLMTMRWGENSLDAWSRMENNLLRVGSLNNKVDPTRFFDNRFIDYANKFDREKIYQLAAKHKSGQPLK